MNEEAPCTDKHTEEVTNEVRICEDFSVFFRMESSIIPNITDHQRDSYRKLKPKIFFKLLFSLSLHQPAELNPGLGQGPFPHPRSPHPFTYSSFVPVKADPALISWAVTCPWVAAICPLTRPDTARGHGATVKWFNLQWLLDKGWEAYCLMCSLDLRQLWLPILIGR